MAALLSRLAVLRSVSRVGARPLTRGERTWTGSCDADKRGQHTHAADPVEVDLKRLEGTDEGTDTFHCSESH